MAAEKEYILKFKERADAVITFYDGLPDTVLRIIYKTIIDEMVIIASLRSKQNCAERFAYAFCEHSNMYAPDLNESTLQPLFGEHSSEVISAINDYINGQITKEDLRAKVVTNLCDWSPDAGLFMSMYPIFSLDIDDSGQFKKHLLSRFSDAFQSYDEKHFKEAYSRFFDKNPFYILGYRTILQKFAYQEITEEDEILVYNWYNKGELLSPVFDVIFGGASTTISAFLWNHLNEQCSANGVLCEIVQQRYDEYRQTHPFVKQYTFHTEGPVNNLPVQDRIYALEPIRVSPEDCTPISDDCYSKLYQHVRDKFDCKNEEEFKEIFSGKSTVLKSRYVWLGGELKELAIFLYYAHGTGKSNRKYERDAANIFQYITATNKVNKCSENTFHTIDFSAKELMRMYRDIFKASGIKRDF